MKLVRTLLAGTALAVAMASSAHAADLLKPSAPVDSGQLFNFEGLYLGVDVGGAVAGTLYGTAGVVVGSNFAVTDGIIAGVEFQGDTYWNSGLAAYDALALGRVGGFVSDNIMAYGEVGAGVAGSSAVYAVGGGLEMAMTNQLSVRGELQALGGFGTFPTIGKATVGLMWHLN